MNRRDLLIGALATAVTATGTAAQAQISCATYNTNGWRTCEVGLRVPQRIALQRCPNWCWAACIEAVFAMNGYTVNQEAIVAKIFGRPRCATASGHSIVAGINGRWRRSDGDSFVATADVLWDMQDAFRKPDAIAQAVTELANNRPLIIGTLGHTAVVTGMTYAQGPGPTYRIKKIIVRDPWPDGPNRRVLTSEERADAAFLTKIWVSA